MPRPKRNITGEDKTGFTFRPGEAHEAFKPSGMLGAKASARSSTQPKRQTKVSPAEAAATKPIEQSKLKESDVLTQTSTTGKANKVADGVAVTVYLQLDSGGELRAKLAALQSNAAVGEKALRKIVVKELRLQCSAQSPERSPTQTAMGQETWCKFYLKIPRQYITRYQEKLDPLGVASMAEIGKSWMAPVIESSLQKVISDLEKKLQTLQ